MVDSGVSCYGFAMSSKPAPRAADEDDLWPIIEAGLEREGEFAIRESLAAGVPVYYWNDDTPDDLAIKEHPDGRRELVRPDRAGDQVIRQLA